MIMLFAMGSPASAQQDPQQDPHAGHQQQKPAAPSSDGPHDHAAMMKQASELPPFIPPVTDADGQAAFPDVAGHHLHDDAVNYFVLVDRVEWQKRGDANSALLDVTGWVGKDRDRFWFRAEGHGEDGRVEEAFVHALYGRQFARWWDVVAGVRQDFRPGSPQTWAALGVQGLAPYRFDIEATAYIGASGRTHARVKVEYELLMTNRLILQPQFEAEIAGKADPSRSVGAGISTTDAGFRLRYEFRRELAPYVGVTWNNSWGGTGDFAEAAGKSRGGARFVTGLRLWF